MITAAKISIMIAMVFLVVGIVVFLYGCSIKPEKFDFSNFVATLLIIDSFAFSSAVCAFIAFVERKTIIPKME